MKHIILLDPLDRLVIKKDSTLLLALTLKERGEEVHLIFPEDFYVLNRSLPHWKVFDFAGDFYDDGIYIQEFSLKNSSQITLSSGDILHMRLDPPFNTFYLKTLWLQTLLENMGVRVVNSPKGILAHNEKILAYEHSSSLSTYIGPVNEGLKDFLRLHQNQHRYLIYKPLDLFQGQGVGRLDLQEPLEQSMESLRNSFGRDHLVLQPFASEIKRGEVRAFYFAAQEVASILKVPREGQFLANVAQGASFSTYELSSSQRQTCDSIAQSLHQEGVPWVAFDLIGEAVSEVNITCPGLLVELSFAHQQNLANIIVDYFKGAPTT